MLHATCTVHTYACTRVHILCAHAQLASSAFGTAHIHGWCDNIGIRKISGLGDHESLDLTGCNGLISVDNLNDIGRVQLMCVQLVWPFLRASTNLCD